jgi:hypothetical protein
MAWHIVRPFVVVLIKLFPLRSKSIQHSLHVLSYCWVAVLIYAKAGRGVEQENVA